MQRRQAHKHTHTHTHTHILIHERAPTHNSLTNTLTHRKEQRRGDVDEIERCASMIVVGE